MHQYPEQLIHQAWKEDAACRNLDPELFFPSRWDMESLAQAKAVCADCPVQAECLEYGLYEDGGVWGGASERQRKKIRSERRRATEAITRGVASARVGT